MTTRDPMWYWRQNNVPWVPEHDEMNDFNAALDEALAKDFRTLSKTAADTEGTRRLYRAVMYRIPFESLTNALWRYAEAHQTTLLGNVTAAVGDRLTWSAMWLNRNGLTRKRP